MNSLNRPCILFDGASKSNPGKVGRGGILIEQGRKNSINFEWGLGIISNDKAKAYGLILGEKIKKIYI